MDLRELRYFRTIAQCGAFSKAAAQLNVAQPALSRQVRKLEHELGVTLLLRTARGVSPTEAGQALLQRTRLLEEQLDEARRYVSGMAETVTGALSVAVQCPVSLILIPDLVKAYRARYPEVALRLREGMSADIIEDLLSGRIDVAIVDTPSHQNVELTSRPLWVETFSLVGPIGDAITGRGRIAPASYAELATLPIIIPSRRHAVRRLVDAAFERQSLRLHPVFEADGAPMIFELVKEGLGYTIMPSSTFQRLAERDELSSVQIRPAIHRTISIVIRAKLHDDRVVATFRALVGEAAQRLVGNERFGPVSFYQAWLPDAGQACAVKA